MSKPPTPPPRSSEDYFNSSRVRVIGMILVATVAVGALGGLAGVVFDPEPVSKDHLIQPGSGSDTRLEPESLGGPGSSAPHGSGLSVPFAVRVPSADSTESPGTVGSISPGASASSGAATESPAPTGDGGSTVPSGSGGATIEATGVDVYIPPGWSVYNQNENQVYFSNGDGSYAFAFSGVEDPSTSAGDIITSALDDLLPPELYTQRRTSDVQTLTPFGSVVSIAAIEYEALWVDDQGSATIHGQIYVGVRQDGTVLGIEIEHVPAEDFPDAAEEMYPILDNSFGRLAGLS